MRLHTLSGYIQHIYLAEHDDGFGEAVKVVDQEEKAAYMVPEVGVDGVIQAERHT